MDIESKRFRIRSAGPGLVEIYHKQTGGRVYTGSHNAPTAAALAMMTEANFDRTMERI